MRSHPCSGHDCDHCTICEIHGICCATVGSTPAAGVASGIPTPALTLSTASLSILRSAQATDNSAGTTPPTLRQVLGVPIARVVRFHGMVDRQDGELFESRKTEPWALPQSTGMSLRTPDVVPPESIRREVPR